MSWAEAKHCHACGALCKYPLVLPRSKRAFCNLECIERHVTRFARKRPPVQKVVRLHPDCDLLRTT